MGRKGIPVDLGRYGKVSASWKLRSQLERRRRMLGDNAKVDALGDDARKGREC